MTRGRMWRKAFVLWITITIVTNTWGCHVQEKKSLFPSPYSRWKFLLWERITIIVQHFKGGQIRWVHFTALLRELLVEGYSSAIVIQAETNSRCTFICTDTQYGCQKPENHNPVQFCSAPFHFGPLCPISFARSQHWRNWQNSPVKV